MSLFKVHHLLSSVVDAVAISHITSISVNINILLSQPGRSFFIGLGFNIPEYQLTTTPSKPLSHQTTKT